MTNSSSNTGGDSSSGSSSNTGGGSSSQGQSWQVDGRHISAITSHSEVRLTCDVHVEEVGSWRVLLSERHAQRVQHVRHLVLQLIGNGWKLHTALERTSDRQCRTSGHASAS